MTTFNFTVKDFKTLTFTVNVSDTQVVVTKHDVSFTTSLAVSAMLVKAAAKPTKIKKVTLQDYRNIMGIAK